LSNGNIEKLIALLRTDEEGEVIAAVLNEFLIDDNKKYTLLVRLKEIKAEVATLGQEVKLTEAEEEIRNIVFAEKKPIIAEEIAKKTSGRFKRLRHTTHALRTLESLASKGVLGKFKRERFYYFTMPKEAVMQALKKRGETPAECSPNEIAKETGMPLYVVLDIIAELLP
jgi:Fe2+ or Zn2+ uptake regulation protein